MADLSPQAQAVLDAYLRAPCDNRLSAAAALRAAVDQVLPEDSPRALDRALRRRFLSIAQQLDTHQ